MGFAGDFGLYMLLDGLKIFDITGTSYVCYDGLNILDYGPKYLFSNILSTQICFRPSGLTGLLEL